MAAAHQRDADPTSATVLVVEDEVLVRLSIADYLRYCGFTVVEASSASEAIAILHSGIRLDLVFSDVRLAIGTEGLVLANWIKEHCPFLKVILTTGHSDAAEKAAELCPDQQLVAKPYSHGDVAERIRALLSAQEISAATENPA
jgi:DNA-binding NtrC family response regulator